MNITFQNAESLIEKFNQDLFERYELINENSYYYSSITNNINSNYIISNDLNNNINYYYYYDNLNNNSSSQLNLNTMESNTKLQYPLSFIDSVNRKQLDLETGYFKEPNKNIFTLSLSDSIKSNLLNPKTAYITDNNLNRTYDLNEAIKLGLITNNNRIVVSKNSSLTLSLADALKTGHLKLGEPIKSYETSNINNNNLNMSNSHCSYSSETQSMSVRSIKDPVSGEFLVPTEAIKRKLLDPYKGSFIHPVSGEHIPISDAIQKGYVLVEIISNNTTQTSNNGNAVNNNNTNNNSNGTSNVISTSLIRETKSYHLLAVYDPLKNDEISIKEAISRGILDRQKGLYVHPQTKETFSISDAISKGVIRARILTPPPNGQQPFNQKLISSNRFEENKSYTICGAIDPRTNTRISLSQAISDGIIDTKNGTYVNIVSGEAISINKAIDLNLVLTELNNGNKNNENKRSSSNHNHSNGHTSNREVKTLNIEFVKDPRTGRNLSVSEAMHSGLLDRHSLNYNNPITKESISLNKAYEKGYIIGHYTDGSYSSSQQTTTSSFQQHHWVIRFVSNNF